MDGLYNEVLLKTMHVSALINLTGLRRFRLVEHGTYAGHFGFAKILAC
jgi:hypothetical protein